MTNASETNSAKRQIGFQLVGAGRRWRQTLDARLAQQGLSDAVWTSLMHLHRLGDGISQSELAASIGIEGSSLVRLLDTLVAQELVERHPHATDRRIKQLYLTEGGRNTVGTIRLHLERIEDTLLAELDEQEAKALLRGLEKVNLGIQRANAQESE